MAELWIEVLIEIWVQLSFVFGGGDVPVQTWEMLSLSEFFIKTPENLYDLQSVTCDWIGEISSGW